MFKWLRNIHLHKWGQTTIVELAGFEVHETKCLVPNCPAIKSRHITMHGGE